uniref:Ig-like domain-containing protein n=1 Tax=Paramormyrops kingsleyae TaxID=1676925 RepID=A0A3B3RS78_9TELE
FLLPPSSQHPSLPVTFKEQLKDQSANEGTSYSRPVKAVWRRNGRPVQPDGRRVVVEQDWNVARLYISRVAAQDGGSYSCEAEGTCVVALLEVQGEPVSHWEDHLAAFRLLHWPTDLYFHLVNYPPSSHKGNYIGL